jgi:hypothetical protein
MFPPLNRRHKAGLFLTLVAAGLCLFFESSAKQTAGIVVLGVAATWLIGSVSVRALAAILFVAAFLAGLGLATVPILQDRDSTQTSRREYDSAIYDVIEAIVKAPVWENVRPISDIEKDAGAPQKQQVEHGPWERYGSTLDNRLHLDTPPLPVGAKLVISPQEFAEKIKAKYPEYGDIPNDKLVELVLAKYPVYKTWIVFPGVRVVDIPSSAITWLRPDKKGSEWDAQTKSFPSNMEQSEILRSFQSNMLLPKPTFSVRASVSLHRFAFIGGLALALFGIVGVVWTIRHAR